MSEKPTPEISSDTEGFWDRCNDEELVVQECTACGDVRLYPTDACPECWSEESTAVVTTGVGTVTSYTVSHRPNSTAFEDDVPYVVALVELEEGVTVMSNIVGASAEDVSIGMDVELVWEHRDGQNVYQFQPVE